MSWIKDVSYEISKLDFSVKSLRKFGITIGGIFVFIGLWFLSQNIFEVTKYVLLVVGLVLLLGGLFTPKTLNSTYKVWMGFAFALGWVMSRVILSVLFVFVITPIGFLAKIFGKEFLDIKFNDNKNSYWIPKESKETNYEKMY
ncbi:MAG: hypothetical protein GY936_08035 [Ignavibacteriae bacterium]|nr:hypothetical protein [Ignavibacteriota bacterium]